MGAHVKATIENFEFTGRLRTSLLAMMLVGILSMVLTYFVYDDHHHTRFWTNVLHNATFVTGIAFTATFFLGVCYTAFAGWHTIFKRIWEAMSTFLIPAFIIMTIIGICVYLGMNDLYHWNDADTVEHDKIIKGKASFLNKNWYLFATIIIGVIWCFFAYKMRSLSLAEDNATGDRKFAHHRSLRWWAPAFLPVAGFTSAAIIWQWIMSIDAHWYSTMFAWYSAASWFVSMIAITILIILYLKSKGYYKNVTDEHMHDLGKFLFAFSIFWTYLWFSQFMLIWYANVGEETIYFNTRMDQYPILFFGNLVINFVLPFFILLRNSTKRKTGTMVLVSILVIFGHWIDFFLMIKPGALHTAHAIAGGGHGHGGHGFQLGFTLPGFLEIGTFIGFMGLFLYVFFYMFSKVPMIPKNDPYLNESLNHHV